MLARYEGQKCGIGVIEGTCWQESCVENNFRGQYSHVWIGEDDENQDIRSGSRDGCWRACARRMRADTGDRSDDAALRVDLRRRSRSAEAPTVERFGRRLHERAWLRTHVSRAHD